METFLWILAIVAGGIVVALLFIVIASVLVIGANEDDG